MVVTGSGSCVVVDTVEAAAVSAREESVIVSVEVTRSLFVVNPEELSVLDTDSVPLSVDFKSVDVSNIVDNGSVETSVLLAARLELREVDGEMVLVSTFDEYSDIIVDVLIMTVESCAKMDVSAIIGVLDRPFVGSTEDAIPFELYSEFDNDVVASTVVLCANDERDVEALRVELETSLVVSESTGVENDELD